MTNAGLLPLNQAPTAPGQVLATTGAGAFTWQRMAPIFQPIVPVGNYLEISNGQVNAGTVAAEAQEIAVYIYVPSTWTFDRIAYQMGGSAGSTGALVRLGIRSVDALSGNPSTLILDAGTDDATVSNQSLHAIVINQRLTAGLYCLTYTVQGAATTRPTAERAATPFFVPSSAVSAPNGRNLQGYMSSGAIAGALPSAYTPSGYALDQQVPWLAIRRSA